MMKEEGAMYQPKLEKDIRCPLEYGLAIFGGKWKSRVICDPKGNGEHYGYRINVDIERPDYERYCEKAAVRRNPASRGI